MKPWCVIRVHAHELTNLRFSMPRRGLNENGLLWAPKQEKATEVLDGVWDSANQHINFVDFEDDAKNLANLLAVKYPAYHYIVAKSVDVYKATPGPVTRSQFTKDGLLPL